MAEKKVPVIVIYAPTACGKTAIARDIFGKSSLSYFKGRGEVVSADSQAVYKGFDIGTAKPTEEEQNDIPHHLIDVAEPSVQFGLGEWIAAAERSVEQIWSRGRIPVIAGGTGFYIRNFILGMPQTPESRPDIRDMVQKKLASVGKQALYAELQVVDPVSATRINLNDEYRICRALEVFYSSGKPLSSFKMPSVPREQYDFCTVVLDRPRQELYRRIDLRVEQMFRLGLEAEVESLMAKGYDSQTPAMKAIGYSEFFEPYGSTSELIEKICNDSHHYAKKQYTLMKDIPGAQIVNADDRLKIMEIIGKFCEIYLTKQA